MHGALIFLGAFLLFGMQPLVGRTLLPAFGGGAGVWITCMLFFQAALLAGYGYAHWWNGQRGGVARRIHQGLVLLVVGLALWPLIGGRPPLLPAFGPGASSAAPAGQILAGLGLRMGPLFLLLSSTSPLVQAWHQRATGGAPYRLYALSNLGSMAGLLLYPFVVEPFVPLSTQGWIYGTLLLLYAGLTFIATPEGAQEGARPAEAPSRNGPARSAALLWMLLSALGTVWLLGVTNKLSSDMASMPLLWVAPLAVYLGTFILVFDSRLDLNRPVIRWILALGLGVFLVGSLFSLLGSGLASTLRLGSAGLTAWDRTSNQVQDLLTLLAALGGLASACLLLHGRLFQLRPEGAEATRYYLYIALGGVLGGSFVGLLAPMIFNKNLELPHVALVTAALLLAWHRRPESLPSLRLPFLGLGAVLVAVAGIWTAAGLIDGDRWYTRDFYGTLRVDHPHPLLISLTNGSTHHGMQLIKQPLRPMSYYGPDGGIGRAIRFMQAKRERVRIGVIGLGVGNVAALARPSDEVIFFEISPADIRVAGTQGTHFSVLRSTPAKVSVYQGDGRISMERWNGGAFDVILVDAFAGGHVPPHLLTREALDVYGRRLAPGGLLALHVSHHLPLPDQVGATLDGSPWNGVLLFSGAVLGRDKAGQELPIEFPSLTWVLAHDAAEIQDPAFEANAAELALQDPAALKPGREPIYRLWKAHSKGLRPWTDDLQSLAPLLYQWVVRKP